MARTYHHVTSAGAGTKSGASWANAMGEAELETDLEGSLGAGDIYYVKDGTFTLDSTIDFSARNGTQAEPATIIGVKSGTTNEGANVTLSDFSTDDADKPKFDISTYNFIGNNYVQFMCVEFEGETNNTVETNDYCLFWKCNFNQDYASSANRHCLLVNKGNIIDDCEFTSAKASGVMLYSDYNKVINCYFYDIPDATGGRGVTTDYHGQMIENCIFDNCSLQIDTNGYDGTAVRFNTFNDGAYDIFADSGSGSWCITNNIFESSSNGAVHFTTQADSNWFDNNHGDDARCNDMWDGVETTSPIYKDNNVSTGDPDFDDAAGGDFKISSSSPCYGTGSQISKGV